MTAPTPPIAPLDLPLSQLDYDLQYLRAKREAAAREKAGLLAEQVRDMKYVNADSPVIPGFEDCECPMCPPAGVTIPRGAAS
ncbi:hypothetical protein ACIGFK_13025 [Streptomyces sp. NPDC085524]|uniref:hypothetical protein n=1 Tax=Streptomyces sp. NPDC085524 TaxID=3365728 RepID=UPI0037D72A52